MKKAVYFGVLLVICFFKSNAQAGTGVLFEEGSGLENIIIKAKATHKYIFIDCFANWCMPCKKMDEGVYPRADVGDFMNQNFISLRAQMDTASEGLPATSSNYALAHYIMVKYNVKTFPSFIFLDPGGNIVHRDGGFLEAGDFLALAHSALDTSKQCYTLLADFQRGHFAYNKMPGLVRALERIGDSDNARDIAAYYIRNYLLPMDEQTLFQKENIRFIASNVGSTHDKAFEWLYLNARKVDSVMAYGRFSEEIIENTIVKYEINPLTKSWDSLGRKDIGGKDWGELEATLRKKYMETVAARSILSAQLRWSRAKKDWDKLVYYEVKKIDNYGLDTTGTDVVFTNNNIYNVIFMHSRNKRIIKKAIGWIQIICNAHPADDDYQDTYANLVYKLGKKKKAIVLEQRAYSFSKEGNKVIQQNLEKMKNGQPTWALN
jgi:thioredoxin-related protein